MTHAARLCVLAAWLALSAVVARAEDWKAVEKVEPYAISGATGPELYASIGDKGPKVGKGRAIAHTNFTLTWTRKYDTQGSACVLVSARPKLTITYTLPRPSRQLPDNIAKHWETFIAGMHAHERVHGDMIKEMVRQIEAQTVGLTIGGDPNCRQIKAEITRRLSAISLAQRQKSRDFDLTEMSDGGNIHQLILALVNGG